MQIRRRARQRAPQLRSSPRRKRGSCGSGRAQIIINITIQATSVRRRELACRQRRSRAGRTSIAIRKLRPLLARISTKLQIRPLMASRMGKKRQPRRAKLHQKINSKNHRRVSNRNQTPIKAMFLFKRSITSRMRRKKSWIWLIPTPTLTKSSESLLMSRVGRRDHRR